MLDKYVREYKSEDEDEYEEEGPQVHKASSHSRKTTLAGRRRSPNNHHYSNAVDVFQDLNVAKACGILGINDREFRELTLEGIKSAFTRKLQSEQAYMAGCRKGERSSAIFASNDPRGAGKKKYSREQIDHKLSGEDAHRKSLMPVHEAYQFLIKKRVLQGSDRSGPSSFEDDTNGFKEDTQKKK